MARGSGAGPEALLREGLAHHRARRWAEAAAAYRALLDLDPEEPNAWNLLGVLALEEGRPAEALPLLERALALYPRGAAYHVNRGNALRHLGRWDEAEAAYRQALGLEPALPDAVLNLGQLFNDRGRYVEAAEVLETGLPRGLEHPAFCLQFSRALRTLGLLAEAEAFERQAAALAPEDPKVLNSIGITRLAQGDARGAVAAFRQALDQDPAHVAAHSNLLGALQYDAAADAEACFQAHLGWGRTHGSAGSGTDAGWPNPRDPDRRIRLGYLSPDFREHSVAYFLEPLLAHHDPRAVEVHAYAHLPSPDEVSGRLRGLVHHWRDITTLGTEEALRLIHADRIDILVDLTGHTGSGRPLVFARRAAPIQVAWLGYPGTTGIPAMDARLSDAIVEPPGAEAWSSERIVRLPRGFHCYRPPAAAPAVAPSPALDAGHVTFGSFNNLAKVGPAVLDLWAALLRRVPGSRLLLKDRALADAAVAGRLRDRFEALGVPANRLDLLPRIPGKEGHLGAYGRVDIALDPFPYNGTTTTCEALWMGVPVLTLPGSRHAARVGASLLTRVGLEDWIATDPADFLARGAAFAADRAALAALRSGLRERMGRSPLRDEAGFARDMEAAYRGLWSEWCRGSLAGRHPHPGA